MFRIIRTVLIAIAVAVPALFCTLYVVDQLKWRPTKTRNSTRTKSTQAAYTVQRPIEPLPPAIDPKEVAAIAARSQPHPPQGIKEDYTWQQIEALLARFRSERKTRPQALDDLESWYVYLAHPIFTSSQDLAEHYTKMSEWSKELPDSAAALAVLADIQINHAWEARGIGLAFTVTEEGWKLFHERIEAANDLLEQALQKNPADGQVFFLQLIVAKAESWTKDEALEVIHKGRQVDPAYSRMYTQMAEYLMPRWHGEKGDIERFAADVVNWVPGDDGLEAYGRIAYAIHSFDPELLYYGYYDRQLLARSAEVLVRRYPLATNLVSFAALMTLVAQDHKAARRVQPFLRGGQTPRVPDWRYEADTFQVWCNARNIPHGESDWIWSGFGSGAGIAFDTDPRFIWCGKSASVHPVVLLDLKNKEIARRLNGPGGGVEHVVIDVQRGWIAAKVQNTEFSGWVLWDIDDSESPLVQKAEPCTAIAINPAREQVAIGDASKVRLFNPVTDTAGPEIAAQHVHFLAFSPDGKLLRVNQAIHNAETGQKVFTLQTADFVAFDPSGRTLATRSITTEKGQRISLLRFSPDGSNQETVIDDLGARGNIAALSLDGKLLAAAAEPIGQEAATIRVWNLSSRQLHKRLDGHHDSIATLAFSADGSKLASVGRTGHIIKIWSLED